jgi:hypothetical protein
VHNEELHNLYFSPNIIKVIKSRIKTWAWHVARMGEMRNVYSISVVKLQAKKTLGRHRHRWDDNIRMDFREIRWEDVGWTHLAQERDQWRAIVSTVMNNRVP